MTEDDYLKIQVIKRRFEHAAARVVNVANYPGTSVLAQDDLGPPEEMLERHQKEFDTWARAEFKEAQDDFVHIHISWS